MSHLQLHLQSETFHDHETYFETFETRIELATNSTQQKEPVDHDERGMTCTNEEIIALMHHYKVPLKNNIDLNNFISNYATENDRNLNENISSIKICRHSICRTNAFLAAGTS